MKVKLKVPVYCSYGNFDKSAEVELPDKIAKGLIAGKYAVVIEKPVAKAEETEQKATKPPAKKSAKKK